MSVTLQARLIREQAALEALSPAWWDLFRRCPAATPFQSPAWLLSWWRCFQPGTLTVAAVFAEERLVALAPLYREEGSGYWRLLPIGISISDYLDVVVDETVSGAGMALVSCLRRDAGARVWHLEDLRPEAAAFGLPFVPEAQREIEPQNACPVLALPENADALEAHLPDRIRRRWRLAQNRLSRRRDAGITSVSKADLDDTLADLFRLHAARWEGRGEAGVLSDERVRRCHGEAAPALLEAGLLRAFRLRIQGRTAGVYYGFQRGPCAYYYLGGFDPDFAFESPGTLLIGHAIRQAVRDGAREFHFLRGQEGYKYDWGAVDRWNQRMSIVWPEHGHAS